MQFPDGQLLVNVFAGTLTLAGMMADAAADTGEGVFLFEEFEGLVIPAILDQGDITLDADMGRTGGLAGRGSALADTETAGDSLWILFKNSPSKVNTFIVFVGKGNRTDLRAFAAACAF